MRSFVKILILLLFITAQIPSVSARQSKTRCEPQKVRVGNVFYTRFSLFYEYGLHNTTNYRRGTFVPVNTPVTFQGKEGNNLFVTLPDGEKISIYNVSAYSGENLDGIFKRTFSTSETDLSKFTEEEQIAIKEGKVRVGMSKAAVIVAIGYPPKHKTPTLESIYWRYWSSRYGTFVVEFQNDRVANIRN